MPNWLIIFITAMISALAGVVVGAIVNWLRKQTNTYKEAVQRKEDERIEKLASGVIKKQDEQYKLENEKFREEMKQEISELRNEFKELNTNLKEVKQELNTKIDSIEEDIDLLKKGTQASLRNDLYELREKYCKRGYASIEEKREFENTYENYHNLGANGVMDYIHKEVMSLPSEKTEKKGKQRLVE